MAAVLLATTALLLMSAPITAQQTDEPFEFALFTPLQVRGENSAIQVFRLSLLYGSNVSVKGLDVGLVSRNTGGESKGLQWALVGYVEGDFVGWQNGWLAGWVEGNLTGLQGPAGFNHAGSRGLPGGPCQHSGRHFGLPVGNREFRREPIRTSDRASEHHREQDFILVSPNPELVVLRIQASG